MPERRPVIEIKINALLFSLIWTLCPLETTTKDNTKDPKASDIVQPTDDSLRDLCFIMLRTMQGENLTLSACYKCCGGTISFVR